MKTYILITSDKIKFILNETEKEGVIRAVAKGDKFVLLQDSMIPLTIPPVVIDAERYYAQENERLATMNKRL